jgi:hypothetical protein
VCSIPDAAIIGRSVTFWDSYASSASLRTIPTPASSRITRFTESACTARTPLMIISVPSRSSAPLSAPHIHAYACPPTGPGFPSPADAPNAFPRTVFTDT